MRHAMIMAGGSGTRLWPMSRKARPKQLLPLIGGRSLLEIAFARLEGTVPAAQRLICAGEVHRAAIRQALPSIRDEQILGEPTGRDSANAVGFTAAVLAKQDPQAVFAVLTSDHLIEPQDEFQRAFDAGFGAVEADRNRFITFSIKPTHAATNYGYVECGEPLREAGLAEVFTAARFTEKPDAATAQKFIDSGRFNWNSGMFIFSAAAFMQAMQQHMPTNHAALIKIAEAWGTSSQRQVLDELYPSLKKISVDFGIMEPVSHDSKSRFAICTVPMNVSWMDVGSWPSYAQTLPADSEGNRGNTKTLHMNSTNVLALSDDPHHTIATIDCADLIIVRTRDATLVCPSASAERIKELAQRVDQALQ